MDSLKDRKVLPIHKRRSDSGDTEPVSWEEEYFARLSESARAAHPPLSAAAEEGDALPGRTVFNVPLNEITFSPFQTREIAGTDELAELKDSILSRGVLQPIIVRKTAEEGGYELVAGERRYRASQLAGLATVPALIENLSDQESLELSIIENAQRENLNPIEEAKAYRLLADRFKLTHAEIAKIVGKNRATISNSLRLIDLEPEVIELLRTGELTAGHGRALLMLEDPAAQLQLARLAVKKALSVRALENIVSRFDEETLSEEPAEEDERLAQSHRRIEQKISSLLGIEKVKISSDAAGAKKLTLSFDTEAAWKRFMAKLRD